jgi:hypothetical protein
LLYLLDANVLINAKNWYYPIARVPEFWEWLVFQGQQSKIGIPIEIYEEFKDTKSKQGEKDELALWAEKKEVKDALCLREEANTDLVSRVIYEGYLPDPTDDDIMKMGRDPFLISYALIDIINRCIVTEEGSKPSRGGANRHIPDVCTALGIRSINTFELIRRLDFNTSWNR